MSVAIVTGAAGLVGSETVRTLGEAGFSVVGIDCDLRSQLFGEQASTQPIRDRLVTEVFDYCHFDTDIRDYQAIEEIFSRFAENSVQLIVHAAAQPSHDWASKDPFTDFSVNATGTLNLLELARNYSPEATFVFVSTNKVYGDTPNQLPMIEAASRWNLATGHAFADNGIDESMSIDRSMHSLFGASKLSADIMVQEYGRYFGMNTACFRCGCITGSAHSGAELHGFLSYLVKSAEADREYTVFGYKGKQVRDNIHARDLARAFLEFHKMPRSGEVYNMGGGMKSNISVLEAIEICEKYTGRPMHWTYDENARRGDHQWWISDIRKFESHYPQWRLKMMNSDIFDDLFCG